MSCLEPRQKFIVYFKDRDRLEPKLKRYVHEGGELYVISYSLDDNSIEVVVWNMNALTGVEFTETFKVPLSELKDIEELAKEPWYAKKRSDTFNDEP